MGFVNNASRIHARHLRPFDSTFNPTYNLLSHYCLDLESLLLSRDSILQHTPIMEALLDQVRDIFEGQIVRKGHW